MYLNIIEQLQDFTDKDFRLIITAIAKYEETGEEPDFSGDKKIAFRFIKAAIDSQAKHKRTTTTPIQGDSTTEQDIAEIISYLNEKAGSRFKPVESNKKFVRARLKDYTLAELKAVIDCKVYSWKNTSMEKYLRPETLFNATKFESYINEVRRKCNSSNTPTKEDKSYEISKGVYKL